MSVHVLADYVFLAVAVGGAIGLWILWDIRCALRPPWSKPAAKHYGEEEKWLPR